MDEKTIITVAAVLSVVAIIASGACVVLAVSNNSQDDTVECYNLYIGLGNDASMKDTVKAEIITRLINTCHTGYTCYEASGAYADEDGNVITDEVTLVFFLTFVEESAVNSFVEEIYNTYGYITLVEKFRCQERLVS